MEAALKTIIAGIVTLRSLGRTYHTPSAANRTIGIHSHADTNSQAIAGITRTSFTTIAYNRANGTSFAP
jgi:hypothetical protein